MSPFRFRLPYHRKAQIRRRTSWIILAILVLGGGGTWAYQSFIYQPVIFGLRSDFAHAVPFQTPPDGLTSISAESCGTCHTEIYQEWKTSIHSQSHVDPFYQAYWQKDNHIWICRNCHSPLENQQPYLVNTLERNRVDRPVKVANPQFDPALRDEGVTCAACHLRNGVIYGPYEDARAPHPTAYDPKFRSTQICYQCHQVPSGPFQFYNGAPCATFLEFENGPYAKQGYICQSCHMPEVERAAALGGPIRHGRMHLWRGGHSRRMLNQALKVNLIPPGPWKSGDHPGFTLRLVNAGAGHKIPTGDPDREFVVSFQEVDEKGRVIRERTHTISRWLIWKPVIVELYDNRIPPRTSREYLYEAEAVSGHWLHVTVSYHILTERAYKKLEQKYGLPPDVPHVFTLFEQNIDLGAGHVDQTVRAPGFRN